LRLRQRRGEPAIDLFGKLLQYSAVERALAGKVMDQARIAEI
jgi:hypothetical protein